MLEAIENIVAFEVALGGDIVMGGEKGSIILTQGARHLVQRPNVKLALFALGIGVQRGAKRSLGCCRSPRQPSHRLARATPEQVIARAQVSEREQFEQERIVVKHLFEMRHEPTLVDRIAREAAAEMIVDAALANASEREVRRRETSAVVLAFPRAPQKFQHHRLRKFGRAAYAAVDRIDYAQELISSAVKVGCGNHHAALGLCAGRQLRHKRGSTTPDSASFSSQISTWASASSHRSLR